MNHCVHPSLQSALPRIGLSISVLTWAAVILYFYESGRLIKYLAPDFRPIALAGGLGLAVMGTFNLCYAFREVEHGHEHEAGTTSSIPSLILMILPVLLSAIWTKDAFSEATLARKGLYDNASISDPLKMSSHLPPPSLKEIEQTHNRTADGYLQFNLMELFFATGDREMQNVLGGLKVATEGRIIMEKNESGTATRMRLYRLFMVCCIADSRVIPIILEFDGAPPSFADKSWVTVAGTMSFPQENGSFRAVLKVDRTSTSEAPLEEKFLIK